MFNPKKTIPKLAVAMLALTGCGDDNGGNGGEGGNGGGGGTGGTAPDFAASLDAFCMNIAPCSDYFTVAGCTAYYVAVNNYNNSSSCTAALISYFDCSATKTCEEIFYDYACLDEYNVVWGEEPDYAGALCVELPPE